MIACLLYNVLVLKEFVWKSLPVILLNICEEIGHGVIDWIRRAIADIREIGLLNCGENLLYEGLLDSRHFVKETHFFGVRNAYFVVHVVGCDIWDDY